MFKAGREVCWLAVSFVVCGCGSFSNHTSPVPTPTPTPTPTYQLTVTTSGTGAGTVTSSPSGINCGSTCKAAFASGTAITLTATPSSGSVFSGWSGACSGATACNITITADTSVTAAFKAPNLSSSINHIIFLAQENRSFDSYFGELRQYWKDNGYPDQSFDGLPQFNPVAGAAPLYGPPPANPGCSPTSPLGDCNPDPTNPVTSFHYQTICTENTSPFWNEAHDDWDYNDPVGVKPAALNGFVWTAAYDAIALKYYDTKGVRAMGYYDGGDLNYYYFMASNFATSDRWFHPVMTRTQSNRQYLIAGTSQGYVYPVGTNSKDSTQLTAKTIFEELQNAGISWKIYVDPKGSSCSGPPYDPACLMTLSYLQDFTFAQTVVSKYPQNIAPISQYFTDLKNGTLPQVAQIEPATDAGYDEHPSVEDSAPSNVQAGAAYVSSLINALMQSSAWSDSVFILTFDESGGLYDHVSPQPAVSPDGIKPVDLEPGDICTSTGSVGPNGETTGPICDFTYTGYRVPLLVVSPFARKNFVDHTVADTTAILRFIETRFNLTALTKRDAAQPDMTEFFDFSNPPWMKPPMPPAQNESGACYLNHLP